MPIYVYEAVNNEKCCDYCKDSFEIYQQISQDALSVCPKCNSPIHRVIQAAGITVGKKHLLTDSNIKKHGFTKLVNEGGGKFRKI